LNQIEDCLHSVVDKQLQL